MTFFTSSKVRGMGEFQAFIDELARNMRGLAAETIADDLIGNGLRGLKHYPPYKYITRRRAFGRPFQSDAQRRLVMGRIRSGRIDPGAPHRTGNYQRSWHREGSGVGSKIVGELPHEGWPNRLAKLINWRPPDEIISTNILHACNAAERAIQKKADEAG